MAVQAVDTGVLPHRMPGEAVTTAQRPPVGLLMNAIAIRAAVAAVVVLAAMAAAVVPAAATMVVPVAKHLSGGGPIAQS